MREVGLATLDDLPGVQEVFNQRWNYKDLSGFTHKQLLEGRVKAKSLAVCREGEKIIGASYITTKHTHIIENGLVATDHEFKRQRVCTALYGFWLYIACLSGRLYLYDFVISDNSVMPEVLRSIGYSKIATQRFKVKRHLDMNWWGLSPNQYPGVVWDRVPDVYKIDENALPQDQYALDLKDNVARFDKSGRGDLSKLAFWRWDLV